MIVDFTLELSSTDYTLDLVENTHALDIDTAVQVIRVEGEPYEGEYEITPEVNAQTLQTRGKLMQDDLTVLGVPYYEVSNLYGDTVYIASEVG